MATTYEIIQGLHQAAANAYDGAHTERYALDGEPRKVGLRREDGDPLLDSRVMDGFKIKIMGNKLYLNYQTDIRLHEATDPKYVNEVEDTIGNIKSFLEKEYRAVTKGSISLKKEGDLKIRIDPVSRIRNSLHACQVYEISSLKDVVPVGQRTGDPTRDIVKKFLSQGRQDAAKPVNDTRKAEKKSK
jgi:hypothetical protein